ncbi:DUF418 domain-containing protein [Niallia sp. XMNu-256]|uniref:DUF418 domain-containing protein n=1 Tax=Niallia sp. XMNu-256 TaxID=3082444 RepID=UPI0030CE9F77
MRGMTAGILEKNRMVSLDIIRGLAILGIFLVNMLSFHSPLLYIEPLEWWQEPFDKWVYMFIDIFIGASFYPLFSMLFGYGLVMSWDRARKRGINFYPIIFRRLFLLLIIGLTHAFLIWHGDILFNYALLGFIFLFFIKLSGKRMLIIGSIFYLLPNLFLFSLLAFTMFIMGATDFSISKPTLISQSIEVYQTGSFLEITRQRIADWSYSNNLFGLLTQLFTLLPLFFIGAGVAKLKWLERVREHQKAFTIIFLIAFILGGLLKILPYILTNNLATSYVQDLFGGPLLAIAYGLVIALLAEKKGIRKGMINFAYVGRMSFSNYLFQSIVATLIFYGYGLGLYGKVSVTFGTLLVLMIYSGQILLSRLWLKFYYYGPAEWGWRNFTYWKKQKFLRKGE